MDKGVQTDAINTQTTNLYFHFTLTQRQYISHISTSVMLLKYYRTRGVDSDKSGTFCHWDDW